MIRCNMILKVVVLVQIQAVKSFLIVYEAKNITRASEKLYVTQQCISQHIKGLEAEMGVKLFERRKTGMVPTEICHRLYPEFQKMIAHYERAQRACAAYQTESGSKITVAIADGLSKYLDINALADLTQGCTGLPLALDECPAAECENRLLSGEADMIFILEPFDSTMIEHVLVTEDYGCVAMLKTNPLAAEEGPIPLERLHGQKTVLGAKTNCVSELFLRYCLHAGVHPRCIISVSDPTWYINNLREDDVIAMVLSRSIPLIDNPDIVTKVVTGPKLIGKCHCCIKKGSEKAEALGELMLLIKKEYENSYARHFRRATV